MTVTAYEAVNNLCMRHLNAYTQKAFEVLEPAAKLQYNWHIGCISEHIEAVFDGDIKDLIINIAPRTLKSVHIAQIAPSWKMGKDPSHQFIGASYAHTLAERNVMKCRQIMQSEWYRDVFPATQISQDQNQKDYFTTTQAGQYKGTGIGGTITGFGCKTLLIDDPINPLEAMSDTIRVKAIDEIRSTLFSRFNDFKLRQFIMIMQRLHEDDPTGNLLKDGGYYHLMLPSIAPKRIQIEMRGQSWTMEQGQYLTPRLDKEVLDKLRTHLGEIHFAGQYMQNPVPIGGGDFRPEWVQFYSQGAIKPAQMNVCILVDPSGGEEINKRKRKLSDWTAMMVVGLGQDNNYYLLDIVRDRLNPTDRINTLFMLHRKWNDACGKSPIVGYERYGMMADTHYILEKQKQDAYNFRLVELGGNIAKEDRIKQLIPDMQNSRWYFPDSLIYVDGEGRKFDLVQEILKSEMPTFPRARHDDMLDALSRIYTPDLNMVFPKMKAGMVEKARRSAASNNSEYNWEDF